MSIFHLGRAFEAGIQRHALVAARPVNASNGASTMALIPFLPTVISGVLVPQSSPARPAALHAVGSRHHVELGELPRQLLGLLAGGMGQQHQIVGLPL